MPLKVPRVPLNFTKPKKQLNGEQKEGNGERVDANEESKGELDGEAQIDQVEEHVDESKHEESEVLDDEEEEGSSVADLQHYEMERPGIANVAFEKLSDDEYVEEILDDWRSRRDQERDIEQQEYEENKRTTFEVVKGAVKSAIAYLNGEFGVSTQRMRNNFLRDVMQGDALAVRIWLLKYGDEEGFVDCISYLDGKTALCIASSNAHPKVAQMILKRRANPNIQDAFGSTALHYACANGCVPIVKMLVNLQANVDIADNNGITSLMKAVECNKFQAAAIVIEAGASINVRDTFNRWTALHYAANGGFLKLTKLLLRSGSSTTITSREKLTATDIALNKAHTEVALHLQNWQGESM